jgi:septal ring factor EnvC (AmiA/AmiB activator)
MGFATIVSILGFAIALVALWLVSDVIKKVENQNEKFIRAHIAIIRDEIRGTEKEVSKLAQAVKILTDNSGVVDKRLNGTNSDFDNVRSRIAKVAEDLDLLDRSIPQRYRVRVVPPKEAEAKAEPKAKPTVQ